MHPEDIKAALRKRGYTQAILADELGVAKSSISQAIAGSKRSTRVQGRIADILELSVHTIWPDQVVLRRSPQACLAARAARLAMVGSLAT